MRIVKSI